MRALCLFQLISGGAGSVDGSSVGVDEQQILTEACLYYSQNNDFTSDHMSNLKRIYPHLDTYKQFTSLCSDHVRSFHSQPQFYSLTCLLSCLQFQQT